MKYIKDRKYDILMKIKEKKGDAAILYTDNPLEYFVGPSFKYDYLLDEVQDLVDSKLIKLYRESEYKKSEKCVVITHNALITDFGKDYLNSAETEYFKSVRLPIWAICIAAASMILSIIAIVVTILK